jgi:hypothetical protein
MPWSKLAQRSLAAGDLPTEGGERPQVVVTMSLGVLRGRIGAASSESGNNAVAITPTLVEYLLRRLAVLAEVLL